MIAGLKFTWSISSICSSLTFFPSMLPISCKAWIHKFGSWGLITRSSHVFTNPESTNFFHNSIKGWKLSPFSKRRLFSHFFVYFALNRNQNKRIFCDFLWIQNFGKHVMIYSLYPNWRQVSRAASTLLCSIWILRICPWSPFLSYKCKVPLKKLCNWHRTKVRNMCLLFYLRFSPTRETDPKKINNFNSWIIKLTKTPSLPCQF